MSGCTQTGKPQIAILMAVYEPRMDWLREQLLSLNAQTYPNLKLYVRDDCSPTVTYKEIQSCVQDCISAFPYVIQHNEKNLGSNGTFEQLTREAEGEYFAYCDQDDIWLPDKLEMLAKALSDTGGTMAYSDVSVIDEEGMPLAPSLRTLRPRLEYLQGTGLAERYFFRNCTAGCAMLVRSWIAKKVLPFPGKTVCDQWLAIAAAAQGHVVFVDRPLVRYRQHSCNQTGILFGVVDKDSYRAYKIAPLAERLDFYRRHWSPSAALEAFVEARRQGKIRIIWHYRALSRPEALAEIGMHMMPEWMFRLILRRIR